jgi:hypothetical protein
MIVEKLGEAIQTIENAIDEKIENNVYRNERQRLNLQDLQKDLYEKK